MIGNLQHPTTTTIMSSKNQTENDDESVELCERSDDEGNFDELPSDSEDEIEVEVEVVSADSAVSANSAYRTMTFDLRKSIITSIENNCAGHALQLLSAFCKHPSINISNADMTSVLTEMGYTTKLTETVQKKPSAAPTNQTALEKARIKIEKENKKLEKEAAAIQKKLEQAQKREQKERDAEAKKIAAETKRAEAEQKKLAAAQKAEEKAAQKAAKATK